MDSVLPVSGACERAGNTDSLSECSGCLGNPANMYGLTQYRYLSSRHHLKANFSGIVQSPKQGTRIVGVPALPCVHGKGVKPDPPVDINLKTKRHCSALISCGNDGSAPHCRASGGRADVRLGLYPPMLFRKCAETV